MSFNTNQIAYISLRNLVAERTSSIVVWCGSGLSAMAGLPTWGGLKSELLDALRNKAATLSPGDSRELMKRAASIEKQGNPWVAFKRLRAGLGRTTYQEQIREILRPAASAPIPYVYRCLWKLPIRGVLNLNLDRMASRAFSKARRGDPVEFQASQAGSLTYVLRGTRPFIANLHGVVDDASTWVFTHKDLADLLNDAQYTNFIRSCVSSNVILFLGLSVDDIAVGGHLDVLNQLGVQTGPHYWVTDRRSIELDHWAEEIGIRLVRYSSLDEEHSELREMFDDLLAFVPPEDTGSPPPVELTRASVVTGELPPPDQLLGEDAETIRQHLNVQAKELLSKAPSYDDYDDFCEQYEEAIHRAWYTSTKPGKNILLGYQLHREVARGAFGRVYHASDSEDRDLAIKVLLVDIRKERNLLHSFRRGV